MNLIDAIQAGDTVTILSPHGSKLKGKAVMRSSAGGWVLNGGGKHGTPLLASNENTIKVVKRGQERKREKSLYSGWEFH